MKLGVLISVVLLASATALCDESPYIALTAPYVARVNVPFQLQVRLEPPSKDLVSVEMELDPSVKFSETHFQLKGSQRKNLTVTVKSNPRTGLIWFYADGDHGYEFGGWTSVDVSFDGHLKPSWSEPIAYDNPTTLSLLIVDNEGKPIPVEGGLELTLDSADGIINGTLEQKPTVLRIASGSRATPQFQLKPRRARGGNVHLTAILTMPNQSHALAQDQFVFTAQPAWWIPVVLALLGGLLHAIYKIVHTPLQDGWRKSIYTWAAIIATSSISGFVGYLFADYDLLGLKLDPNVLRTYPIVGLLFSYFGIEGLLSDRFSRKDFVKTPRSELDSAKETSKAQAQASGE